MKKTKKGFTLVELLVVIAILAILAAVSVVGYTSFITKAEQSSADQEIHQIKTIVESALIVNDYATITKKDSTTLYLSKGTDNKITVTQTKPDDSTDKNTIDLTNDIGTELVEKLTFATDKLSYKYKATSTEQTIYPVG